MEKKYDFQKYEVEIQEQWEKEQTYSMNNNPGQLYSIDTPPPTVSGKLHIGHIFSYTQTDIIARYKRMNGFSVYYPFGFDDNGLPTERYVEKKKKIRASQMLRSAFIKLCIDESKQAAEQFKELWQRLGLSVDWNYLYSTISDSTRKLSQESFLELYKKGYIYRRDEPALYCTTCRTSVSQAELDDKELPSVFNSIIFKDEKGNDLVIGTTRPELLPSCIALVFNPTDERYQHLIGTKAAVPLFNVKVPILQDELVDKEKGSGLVMICTFGDKTDIVWYKKFDLPYKQTIGLGGKFTKQGGFLEGLNVVDAREKILDKLREQNLLITQQSITHSVNIHERCKKEIEFILLSQWFVKILEHKKALLEQAEHINWYPSFMKARYKDWVENISWDWCISRQRFYGIPFPVWHCKNCGQLLFAKIDDLPVDPQETPYKGNCTNCGESDIVPDTDVMDTWNTSSLSPYICYKLLNDDESTLSSDDILTKFMPMSMRPQAHDIIRTWAFYTIVKTWMHHHTIPWRDIIISGHILADKQEKLSKSKNNSLLEPENLLQQYSTDAIRYWTASGHLGYDVVFSEDQLKIGRRLVTKLWNAFRFAQPHLITFNTPKKEPEELGAVNEWLLHRITICFANYKKYFEKQEFSPALEQIEKLFWRDFCDNYIELIKHQLFNPQDYPEKTIYATQWTLYYAGLRILQLYAPYLPYVTETIYQLLYKSFEGIASIHQIQFSIIQTPYIFQKSSELVDTIISIVTEVRKLKTGEQLSLKVPLSSLIIYFEDELQQVELKNYNQLFHGITHAQEISYKKGKLEKPEIKLIDGFWHARISN
ncbi:MAG: valine--tRNA ligase [Candidatus Babeliales bacterium]